MKRIILLIALIIIVPVGGYLWHRQQPEQQINRAVDQFLENVEHRKISIRNKQDVHSELKEVLADKIDFQGNWPIPTDPLTIDETLAKIDQFHVVTSLCEITISERELQIIGSKAQVYLTTQVHVAAGKKNQVKQNWEFTVDLEEGDDWRITGFRGKELD